MTSRIFVYAVPGQSAPGATTHSIGEEDAGGPAQGTTLAVGEEDAGGPVQGTTLAVGEEDAICARSSSSRGVTGWMDAVRRR